jgi:tetratricopeptide (TPR) repeat protein
MFAGLKSRLTTGVLPRFQEWTSDRAHDQIEGEQFLDTGDNAQAEICFARAIVDAEKRRMPTHRRIELRVELAEAQRRQASQPGSTEKLSFAVATAREALELAARAAERDLEVQCLDLLGSILFDAGIDEELEQVTRQAVGIEASMPKANLNFTARRLQRLGTMRLRVGRVSDAITTLEEVVELMEKIHGSDSLEIANQLTELGDAHRFLGSHAKAQKSLTRAQRIHESLCGLNSPEALHDLSLLTASYEACGDFEAAATMHERVLAQKLREVGLDLEQIAQDQTGLAAMHVKWGNPSRARELLMEAIGTLRRTKGVRLAAAYESLAMIEESSGHLQDALKQLANASSVWENLGPNYLTERIRNLEYRAQLLDRLHLGGDAAFFRTQALELGQAQPVAQAG